MLEAVWKTALCKERGAQENQVVKNKENVAKNIFSQTLQNGSKVHLE